MRWAKLNAHTDASGNLGACSRITSINGWHEISGACYECRCRSCPYPCIEPRDGVLDLRFISLMVKVKVKDEERDYISEH